jgi:hypothetical protein|nr:hypothetical protein [Kofleriaceae bacterium]
MRTALSLLVLAVAACSHPPPPVAPPAEKTVTSIADVAGTWVRDDDMGWFYTLTIDASGKLVQYVERDKLGRCEQKGTLAKGDSPTHYTLALAHDTCKELADAPSGPLAIDSFTGTALTLTVGATQRVYRRDPNAVKP